MKIAGNVEIELTKEEISRIARELYRMQQLRPDDLVGTKDLKDTVTNPEDLGASGDE